MTGDQRTRLYFPVWHRTCAALAWCEEKKRLVLPEAVYNQYARQAIEAGRRLAAGEARALTLRDIRKGVTICVTGRNKDTNRLSNREVSDCVNWFKLMVEETNLEAGAKLANPELSEKEGLVRRIKKLAPHAVIDGVCQRSFAPVYQAPYWEDLPVANLRSLTGILVKIRERQRAAAGNEEDPF